MLNNAGDAGDTCNAGDLVVCLLVTYSVDNWSMGEGANLLHTRR